VIPQAFNGGAHDTTIGVAAGVALCLAIAWILLGPRKQIVVPVLVALLLIPSGNVVVAAGQHLTIARIITLFGCVRLLVSGQLSLNSKYIPGGWNSIDATFVFWALSSSGITILLWQTSAAVVLEIGHLWALLGLYLILRTLIQDDRDIALTIKVLVAISFLVAAEMLYEHVRGQNLFGLFLGGVQTVPLTRGGSVRAQGPFQHSISAGVFGGTLVPLLLWLRKNSGARLPTVVGLISCTAMVLTSASSTPVGAYLGGLGALLFWPMRRQMRPIRYAIVAMLIALHLVMKAPVWFLIARVSFVSASTASFRAELIDGFVKHFSEWWLLGVKSSYDWGPSMWDLSNQFVNEGLRGGLLTLILFIAIIKNAYSRIGRLRRSVAGDSRAEWSAWLLGCALFAHLNAFFGVSYWDTVQFVWIAVLVIVSAATREVSRPKPQTSKASIGSLVNTESLLEPAASSLS